ncbi:dipeptide epimerase [Sinanaerobacter chloroacetimidivorans]|jgi:o-succinylbenzoate synthase|uniref:Dipeptide epimerase n=1 Tax=Sinanaerobacter chloroacetimidivorans TaxID=2818044 RepID=A0A8J7VZ63_9FIRM|nr:dipeptide epimerase [Sinanaerobacter chloroacetimidivorans]MBR0597822.1 dipeptide epimerase [Sinanaerobacter chloroacetimidivorans]
MKIQDIEIKHISISLKKPFKTALRRVDSAENTVVIIHADDGQTGFGEAPPTAVITGDTNESVVAAIKLMRKSLIGMDIDCLDNIMYHIDGSCLNNTSAKAAVDMAVYDLAAKSCGKPLYKYLGGYRNCVETDLTISLNEPDEMCKDSMEAVSQGFRALKLKVGLDPEKDIERVSAVREAVGKQIKLRLDANQGWRPKEAVRVIRTLEDKGLDIELVEQPVNAADIGGMQFVTNQVSTPIMADESIFSPADALRILQIRAADILNIKLMKCGGIHNALKINAIAETYGVECMLGSMIESKISLTAATHLASAKKNITRVDLDAAILLSEDPVLGGLRKEIPRFYPGDASGLGIFGIRDLKDVK